jgi:hypothetical protein
MPTVSPVPAALARRRSVTTVTAWLAGLAVIWVGPALLLRPMLDPESLALPAGFAVALGFIGMRGISTARGRDRYRQDNLLTVRTMSGPRTIDLRSLRRIRARRFPGNQAFYDYIIVTDTAGVTVMFSRDDDMKVINKALDKQFGRPELVGQPGGPVYISRLAKGVLGIERLPFGVSTLWNMAMLLLFLAPMGACAGTVMALAGG